MSLAEEKDYVLNYINGVGSVNLNDFLFNPESPFPPLFFKHRHELEEKGFVTFQEFQDPVVDIREATLNPAGRTLLVHGGYTAIEAKEQKEERRKEQEWRWRRGYEAASAIVAIAALGVAILTFVNTPKESDFEKLKAQVDSLNRIKPAVTITPTISSTSTKNKP